MSKNIRTGPLAGLLPKEQKHNLHSMEQSLETKSILPKVYSEKALSLGTLLGGPLTAGYIFAENYKAFNEQGKAKKSWILSFLASVLIFGGVALVPDNVKMPNQLIPFVYTLIASLLFQRLQGQRVKAHLQAKGTLFSLWRAAAVGLIGIVITLLAILGIALTLDGISTSSMPTITYGSMQHEISFDNSNISVQEVNKIADAFIETGFFDQAVTKYVHAKKTNNGYELSIHVLASVQNKSEALQPFRELRADLQSMFPRHEIVFKLVVDDLKQTIKILK